MIALSIPHGPADEEKFMLTVGTKFRYTIRWSFFLCYCWINGWMDRHTERQRRREAERQRGREADRQTDRQAGRHK